MTSAIDRPFKFEVEIRHSRRYNRIDNDKTRKRIEDGKGFTVFIFGGIISQSNCGNSRSDEIKAF
jgi:hypothetical protein